MTSRRDTTDDDIGTTIGVTTALDELKPRGAAMLVVGTVPETVYARLSAEMLGAGPDRRRLVVESGQELPARLDAVDRWTPERIRVLRCRMDSRRSAAASDRGPSPEGMDRPDDGVTDGGREAVTETVEGSIADLGVAVGSAIGWFDAVAAGLDPAELRVAFDCIAPLLSEYSDRAVFRLLHLLTNQIRAVDGLGHVRLSRPPDSETARLFAPLFDVIVELDLDGADARHRWHVRDAGVTSEWLPLDSIG